MIGPQVGRRLTWIIASSKRVDECARTMTKRLQVLVCDGPSCGLCYESEQLVEHIEARIAKSEALKGRVFVTNLTCFGRCDEGPNMLVRELEDGEDGELEPDFEKLEGVRGLYLGMDVARVDRMLDEHCMRGQPIEAWAERY